MLRYLVLYTSVSEKHTNAVLTLLRYMSVSGAVEISSDSPLGLPDKLVYVLDVKNDTAEQLLRQLYIEDVLDYRDELDNDTRTEIENAKYPEGDAYMERRTCFAIVDGVVEFMDQKMCGFSTADWLRLHCCIHGQEATDTVCGHITKGVVRIFHGEDYLDVAMNDIPESCLKTILKKAHAIFGDESVRLLNGAIPADPGIEWKERRFEGTYSTKTTQ